MSFDGSTQAEPQVIVPVGHGPGAHLPAAQTCPVGHTVPHAPQFAGSLAVVVHAVPHKVIPVMHAHLPAEHTSVSRQRVPQSPQLRGSEVMSRHAVPPPPPDGQTLPVEGHAHLPATQAGAESGQLMPQSPQLRGSDDVSRQRPPQSLVPAPQTQTPDTHVEPVPQFLPHEPQFTGSVERSLQ